MFSASESVLGIRNIRDLWRTTANIEPKVKQKLNFTRCLMVLKLKSTPISLMIASLFHSLRYGVQTVCCSLRDSKELEAMNTENWWVWCQHIKCVIHLKSKSNEFKSQSLVISHRQELRPKWLQSLHIIASSFKYRSKSLMSSPFIVHVHSRPCYHCVDRRHGRHYRLSSLPNLWFNDVWLAPRIHRTRTHDLILYHLPRMPCAMNYIRILLLASGHGGDRRRRRRYHRLATCV